LSRWLDGNRDELSPIRIPTEDDQRQRETTRRRSFLNRLIRMLANRGHGQVAEYAHLKLPTHWWGQRNWKKIEALNPWLREQLSKLRDLILPLEAQVAALESEVVARVAGQERPKGLGELSLVTLDSSNPTGQRDRIQTFDNTGHVGRAAKFCCRDGRTLLRSKSTPTIPADSLHETNLTWRRNASSISPPRMVNCLVLTRCPLKIR